MLKNLIKSACVCWDTEAVKRVPLSGMALVKMYTTYIIQSIKTGKFYIGQTSNIEERLNRHNTNRSVYTKNKGPFKIVHLESFATRSEACRREHEIKAYKGGIQFKSLVK